ncbi:hypothetical protein FB451DRAFT_220648 [Mycena latifolia]|nr:hypothetical protein FB451DRAFT_220648 [Mycena latifolia]
MKSPAAEDEKTLDAQSVFSDRTLCASPEPAVNVPRVLPAQTRPAPEQALRVKTRTMSAVALVLWSIDLSLSLVEHFRMVNMHSSGFQSRLLLVWSVCSGLFVVITAAVFISTLLRRPHRPFLNFLRGFAIFMSLTGSVVGFGLMFPVIAECSIGECSRKERVMRLWLCLGVPVTSVWTWLWIPTIRSFLPELDQ